MSIDENALLPDPDRAVVAVEPPVAVLEAADPAAFDARSRVTVLPGDPKTGVKDTVIVRRDGVWHLWASCHPLADPDEADQMVTDYATSADGLEWTWHGTALSGRPGLWDARGVRIGAVRFDGDRVVAFYDGRVSAAENYEERTGPRRWSRASTGSVRAAGPPLAGGRPSVRKNFGSLTVDR
ncbi:hypothetical protein AB0L65_55540 [Nonomuraea sp. NPDC052116]|uniref:hypothetical protein n=1 Tax=Nonomuraea sp. NPDC052116 TaxID=3155665 RepID=UPI003417EE7C